MKSLSSSMVVSFSGANFMVSSCNSCEALNSMGGKFTCLTTTLGFTYLVFFIILCLLSLVV